MLGCVKQKLYCVVVMFCLECMSEAWVSENEGKLNLSLQNMYIELRNGSVDLCV